jgi:hypothetical protein
MALNTGICIILKKQYSQLILSTGVYLNAEETAALLATRNQMRRRGHPQGFRTGDGVDAAGHEQFGTECEHSDKGLFVFP